MSDEAEVQRQEDEYSLTPLGVLINTGFALAEALKPFPEFDDLREEWGRAFDAYMLEGRRKMAAKERDK